MNATNGHGGPDAGTAVTTARSVVLVRYRPGVTGETARTVHVVTLPTDEQVGAVGALCGAALSLADLETVSPGEGMPGAVCLLTRVLATSPTVKPGASDPASTDTAGLAADGDCYKQWGWPVTLHRDQVRLSLHREVVALAIPVPLGKEMIEILDRRRYAPPVLVHQQVLQARPGRLTGHRIRGARTQEPPALPTPRTRR